MGMSVSLKKATNKTNLKHNNREQKEYDNKEIDVSRMKYNKYLVQENIRDLYEREFGEVLKKYNDKQRRKDRKIKSYYNHVLEGKKTSTQQEIVIQVGSGFHAEDYEFGDNNWNKVNEILEEYFHEFEKRNPNLKVYNAVIHNDETSPHLHINFVPVASGYKRGLEKQVAFDRAIKQQSIQFDVSHPFEVWRESEVAELEKLMRERSIERKKVGTNEYEDTNELKEVTEKLREIEIKVENELEKLDVLVDKPKSNSDVIEPIVALGEENKPMPKVELKKTITGKYTVEPEQVENLKEYAMGLKHKNTDLQDEINKRDENYRKLRKSYLNDRKMIDKLVNDKMYSERQKWSYERLNYHREVFTLGKEINTLENENKELKRENRVLKQWKNKAVEFMRNTEIYKRFEKFINRDKKHDLER